MKLVTKLAKEAEKKTNYSFGDEFNESGAFIEGFESGFRKALELAADIPKNKDISYYDEDIKAAVLMHTIQTSILKIADQEAPEGGWVGINDKTGLAE